MPFSYFLLTSIFLLVSSNEDNYVENEVKTLDPVELIDLVLKEQKLAVSAPVSGSPSGHSRNIRKVNRMFDVDIIEDPTTTTTTTVAMALAIISKDGDGELLKGRKVWSRWSKWSACSVSCGTGSVARRRVCLAGRCAIGEREEQRRPCARPPCPHCHTPADDDARTLDELHLQHELD